jgi:hypothetical protein
VSLLDALAEIHDLANKGPHDCSPLKRPIGPTVAQMPHQIEALAAFGHGRPGCQHGEDARLLRTKFHIVSSVTGHVLDSGPPTTRPGTQKEEERI